MPTNDFSALAVVAVSLTTSVIAPAFLLWMTNRNRRQEKTDDNARQDELSRRAAKEIADRLVESNKEVALEAQIKAEKTAGLLLASNKAVAAEALLKANETASLLAESNEIMKATAKEQGGQLQQIHTLVNSNLSAAKENELEAMKSWLVSLEEIVLLRRGQGEQPTGAAQERIAVTRSKVAELEAQVADRKKQTSAANEELKKGTRG